MYVVKTTNYECCGCFCAEIEQNGRRLPHAYDAKQNGVPVDNIYKSVLLVLLLSAKMRYIFLFLKGADKRGNYRIVSHM